MIVVERNLSRVTLAASGSNQQLLPLVRPRNKFTSHVKGHVPCSQQLVL